jgi:NADH-quinone oxidoreductase subunit J
VDGINWHSLFFLLFALLSCGFALMVVLSSSIVRMAFNLVFALGSVAGLFFLAGADLLGAVQLLVYVGGTMVLLVFGVMLTARGPLSAIKTGGGAWVAAVIVAGSLLAVLLQAAVSVDDWTGAQPVGPAERPAAEPTSRPLGMGLLGVRVDKMDQPSPMLREGMSGYLLGFEIVSVHLLVVLVGAAYLARARRRTGRPNDQAPMTNEAPSTNDQLTADR